MEKSHILVLRSNGALELIPAEDDVFVQARGLLSGCYIECLNTCIPGLVMLVDSDGKQKGLSTNDRATALYPNRFDYIVGDVVFVNKGSRKDKLCGKEEQQCSGTSFAFKENEVSEICCDNNNDFIPLKDSGYVEAVLGKVI